MTITHAMNTAYRVLNCAREGIDDLTDADVSAPGESEPGEFYVTLDGVDLAVRVELI